ncbi:MAG: SRPBCC family protein [Bacteroidota bacterium]
MLHTIQTKQHINSDLETVWDFMRSPLNLQKITPSYLGFEILTPKTELNEMYAGQIIEYYVKPIAGIKLHWVTEITHVEHLRLFVDEQRFGPYAFWHHQHHLKAVDNSVEMIDIVHYKLPLGIFGKLLNKVMVANQLKTIFDYRFNKIEELFNQTKVKL